MPTPVAHRPPDRPCRGRLGLHQRHPPPATIPSSTAALVAETASSMRCFFSASSTSVAAPTLITARFGSWPRRSWASRGRSRGPSLRLGLELVEPALDLRPFAAAFDDRGVVLGDDHLPSAPQQIERDVLELEPDLVGDDLPACEDGQVLEHRLAAIAEAGGLDRYGLERATHLVHDERGEGRSVDVLGNDHQRTFGRDDLLEQREHVFHPRDLALDQQDVGSSYETSIRSGSVTKYGEM